MNWVNGLAIKYKILSIGAVGILGFAINLFYSFSINSSNQERLENIKEADFPVVEHVIANVNRLDKIKQLLSNAFEMGEPDLITEASKVADSVNLSYGEVKSIIEKEIFHSQGYISLLLEQVDVVRKAFNDYFDVAKPLTANLVSGEKSLEDLQPDIAKMNEALSTYTQVMLSFKEISYQHFVNTIYEAKHASDQATQLALGIGLIVVLTLIIASILMSKVIRNNISSVAQSLKNIASGEGDLTQRLTTPSRDEIGQLVQNFNLFVEKLQGIIGKVAQSTNHLISSSQELSSSSTSANAVAREQQIQIDHIASAINQMTESIQNVASNAASAASSANNAHSSTENGRKVVAENMKSIDTLASEIENAANVTQKLKADSESVNMVLDVIKGIAEQTNLLALNASIEAARAGEQGRGFAVVAEEVRSLANKTQESTNQIEKIIHGLQENAGQVVKAMERSQSKAVESVERADEAGSSFDIITSAVTAINSMNTEIASTVEQQSSTAEEINSNVSRIRDNAQKSAQSADQAAAASTQLSKLSRDLEKLVNQFKV